MNYFRSEVSDAVAKVSSEDVEQDTYTSREGVGSNSPSLVAASSLVVGALDGGVALDATKQNSFQVSNEAAIAEAASASDSFTLTLETVRSLGIKAAVFTNGDGTQACGGCGQCAGCRQGTFAYYDGTEFNIAAATVGADLNQTVFLDFDTNADANPFFDEGPIVYTPEMRAEIQVMLNEIYESYGVNYVLEQPDSGDFSTVLFRTTPTNPDGTPSGSTGLAIEGIDFRNQNRNDTVILNILIGFGLTPDTPDSQIVEAATNVAAHEIAHAIGLRHHDSFGPIGSGISPFLPFVDFPGPADANETEFHVINTPAFGGDDDFFGERFIGAREAAKLTFAAVGQTVNESAADNDSFANAEAIELQLLVAPNTIEFGQDAGTGDFVIEAAVVLGSFDAFDPVDTFSFEGQANRAYSFEVISETLPSLFNNGLDIDPTIAIFDSNFQLVEYFGDVAFNDDDLEGSFDSHLFDVFLPEDGTYFIEVDTFSEADTGQYELFIQSFDTSPFPLPGVDDFSDDLNFTSAASLVFQDNSNNVIARADGAIGVIGNPGERDVFSFTIDTGSRVIVDARTNTNFFDTFLEIFNGDGQRVAFNDNTLNPSFNTPTDSQIVIENLAAGDYFVAISGTNETVGEYRLGVRHNSAIGSFDDNGDSLLSATTLELNPLGQTTFVNASAEFGSDSDVFAFTSLTTGQVIVRTLATSGDLNTVLRGFDPDRQLVAGNNNFNGTLDSRIELDVLAGETYFLRLSTVGETFGDYRFSIRTIESETVAPPVDNGPASLGARISDPNIDLRLEPSVVASSETSATAIEDLGRVDQFDETTGGFLA